MDLRNRPIAITGASSGIGMATALACAQVGMPVAVGARREANLDVLVNRIREQGGRAIAVRTNVDDPADCRRLIERTVEEFGSIYAVMANAGYGVERAVHEMTDESLRAIFETNFFGTMNTIRPALEHMLAGRGSGTGETGPNGHIIMVSSCLSKLGTPWYGAYTATKAAQDHIARAMRLELAASGVLVSSVHPIGTKTEFFTTADRLSGGSFAVHTPDFFMQTPERVARSIVRALRRERGSEVWTSTPIRVLLALATAFPSITDRVLRVHVQRRMRFYQPRPAEGDPESAQASVEPTSGQSGT